MVLDVVNKLNAKIKTDDIHTNLMPVPISFQLPLLFLKFFLGLLDSNKTTKYVSELKFSCFFRKALRTKHFYITLM